MGNEKKTKTQKNYYLSAAQQAEGCRAKNDIDGYTPLHKAASNKSLRISSLNICRGLEFKEDLLKHTIMDEKFVICRVSEVDIEHFDEKKPFSIKGYKTYAGLFPS